LVLIDAVHSAYHKRQLALLKPLLPPEVWEALRQEAMTVPHRLRDPEGVDIWTSERQTRMALRRSPLRPMPLVVLAHGRVDPAPPGWPGEEVERLWQQLQRELAQLVPGGRLVIATQSGHDIQTSSRSWSWMPSATSSEPYGPATWCPSESGSATQVIGRIPGQPTSALPDAAGCPVRHP
jgi:hypothetical protein